MNTNQKKKSIIEAGYKAVDELIKVAKEKIVDSDDDVSADRLKNAAATKKLAIFDAFEILNRIEEEKNILEIIKQNSPAHLVDVKEKASLSNKKWDKSIKGLGQKKIIKIIKEKNTISIELLNNSI